MNKQNGWLLIIFYCCFFCDTSALSHPFYCRQSPQQVVVNSIRDVVQMYRNLLSWNSYKVIAGTIPAVILGGMLDERVHSCFYDFSCHKNIHQFNSFCSGFAKYGIIFPVFFGAATAYAAQDEPLVQTSRMFLKGLPFVIFTANIIKKIPWGDCGLRPWNGNFSRCHRTPGGFPSGHVALASFATFLYGDQLGAAYAIPFGIYTFFLAAAFINCNRHYASQLMAGVGLGALFGLAASSVVSEKMACFSKHIQVALEMGTPDHVACKLSYRF